MTNASDFDIKGSVVLVGCGRMGGALLSGWEIGQQVYVLDPNAPMDLACNRLESGDMIACLPRPLTIIIAVKPQIVRNVLPTLVQLVASDTVFVSVAAGVRTDVFHEMLGSTARVVRAMPNIAVAARSGATVVFSSANVSCEQIEHVRKLFGMVGRCVLVAEERLVDVGTALVGSGPAFFFCLGEALAAAAYAEGMPAEQAEMLAEATLAGAGALCRDGNRRLATLREAVTSPGGTTAAALDAFTAEAGIYALATAAVRAAVSRAAELAI